MPHQYRPSLDVIPLLKSLDEKLMELLYSLQPGDWQKRTVAVQWTIKDVIAHLLDGNFRVLSTLRDGHVPGSSIQPNQNLVAYLNELNADWVKAMKRVSPALLVLLHEITGPLFIQYYSSIHPEGKAAFSVAWLGEEESFNSMHIAREYTEKWIHQQQVRAALDDDGIMTGEFFYPCMDIFMMALPYTYGQTMAAEGTTIRVTITGAAGGSWDLQRSKDEWILHREPAGIPDSEVIIPPDIAWRLFSKSLSPGEAAKMIVIKGDEPLGQVALSMVSVMA